MKKYSALISSTLLIFIDLTWVQQNITFTLKPISAIKSLHVVGDFNGWSKTANPLHDKNNDGIWETTIMLQPGEYQYRFLIDDRLWIKDPQNPNWGGETIVILFSR